MPRTVNPTYAKVAQTIARHQNVEFESTGFDRRTGRMDIRSLEELDRGAARHAALVIQQPNFFGNLEEIDALTDWAHANRLLVIAVVNPTSLALLKPPGEWGSEASGNRGADIVCGEGQPLGVPLASGGPYFGFMATRLCARAADARAHRRAHRRCATAGRVSR